MAVSAPQLTSPRVTASPSAGGGGARTDPTSAHRPRARIETWTSATVAVSPSARGAVFLSLADIVGACIYGHYYHHRCLGIGGHFEGTQALSAARFAILPESSKAVRTPARDYSHSGRYWSAIKAMEFKRTDVAPPSGGRVVAGFYGFRELAG
jgi:hypothetical protein